MNLKILRTRSAALLIIPFNLVLADPVRWSGNGHYYEVISVPGTISWEDADAAALGAGGYLATITSPAENAFVFGLVSNPAFWHGFSGPWLGGYQFPATQQANANWRWVTGETWSYTNWQLGQPNDSGGKVEDKLQFGFDTMTPMWNDIMSVDPTPDYRPIAYVIEWNNDPFAPILEASWSPTNSQVVLCWQSAPNRFYQLQFSGALTNNQWAPLNSNWVSGDGMRHCETDVILYDTPIRFYRLLCTNAPPP